MRKLLSVCSLLGLVMAPAAQAQDGVTVFKPTSGWTADYGDDYCRLIRTFSDGSGEISLALERLQPGTGVGMILVGDGFNLYRGTDQIGYKFSPSGAAAKSGFVRSTTADGKRYVKVDPVALAPIPAPDGPMPEFDPTKPFVPPPYDRAKEQETANGVDAIAFTEGLTSPVRIETGPLQAPVAAMQACADDLLQVWGLDMAQHKTMTAPVALVPSSDGILPQGTIPFGDFGKLAGGANQVRVMVGADGKPTACSIYSASLSQSLNDKICKLVMEKAAFVPAKDSGGQAMASYWMGSPMFLGPPFPGGRRR